MALFGNKKEETKDTAKAGKAVAAKKSGTTPTDRNYHGLFLRPRITEKATLGIEAGKYVFEVPQDATKTDLKAALKEVYNVVPAKITIVRRRPQKFVSRMRRRSGQHAGFKKAIVHLKKGETMDIMG